LFIITKFSNDENEIVGFCRVFSLHGEFVIPMISSLTFIIAEGAKKTAVKSAGRALRADLQDRHQERFSVFCRESGIY